MSVDNEEILDDQKDSVEINNNTPTTYISDPQTLVLQICPDLNGGTILINGKLAQKIAAWIFIPKLIGKIYSPLHYFQENASLPEKWINTVSGDKLKLEYIDELKRVAITVKVQGEEKEYKLPDDYGIRLFDYFKLDICHNLGRFIDFDCYAFVSLLANVKHNPLEPALNNSYRTSKLGAIVIFLFLISSIKELIFCSAFGTLFSAKSLKTLVSK